MPQMTHVGPKKNTVSGLERYFAKWRLFHTYTAGGGGGSMYSCGPRAHPPVGIPRPRHPDLPAEVCSLKVGDLKLET